MDKKPDLKIEDLIPDLQQKLNDALVASGLFPAAAFPVTLTDSPAHDEAVDDEEEG